MKEEINNNLDVKYIVRMENGKASCTDKKNCSEKTSSRCLGELFETKKARGPV